ncbi:MAG TPA: hypothetical protein VFS75_02725 [Candidatus Paceibacterota bacterium]|nr:hypothetical protein [Candidatus Paceibacterota bacterium]
MQLFAAITLLAITACVAALVTFFSVRRHFAGRVVDMSSGWMEELFPDGRYRVHIENAKKGLVSIQSFSEGTVRLCRFAEGIPEVFRKSELVTLERCTEVIEMGFEYVTHVRSRRWVATPALVPTLSSEAKSEGSYATV